MKKLLLVLGLLCVFQVTQSSEPLNNKQLPQDISDSQVVVSNLQTMDFEKTTEYGKKILSSIIEDGRKLNKYKHEIKDQILILLNNFFELNFNKFNESINNLLSLVDNDTEFHINITGNDSILCNSFKYSRFEPVKLINFLQDIKKYLQKLTQNCITNYSIARNIINDKASILISSQKDKIQNILENIFNYNEIVNVFLSTMQSSFLDNNEFISLKKLDNDKFINIILSVIMRNYLKNNNGKYDIVRRVFFIIDNNKQKAIIDKIQSDKYKSFITKLLLSNENVNKAIKIFQDKIVMNNNEAQTYCNKVVMTILHELDPEKLDYNSELNLKKVNYNDKFSTLKKYNTLWFFIIQDIFNNGNNSIATEYGKENKYGIITKYLNLIDEVNASLLNKTKSVLKDYGIDVINISDLKDNDGKKLNSISTDDLYYIIMNIEDKNKVITKQINKSLIEIITKQISQEVYNKNLHSLNKIKNLNHNNNQKESCHFWSKLIISNLSLFDFNSININKENINDIYGINKFLKDLLNQTRKYTEAINELENIIKQDFIISKNNGNQVINDFAKNCRPIFEKCKLLINDIENKIKELLERNEMLLINKDEKIKTKGEDKILYEKSEEIKLGNKISPNKDEEINYNSEKKLDEARLNIVLSLKKFRFTEEQIAKKTRMDVTKVKQLLNN